MTDYRALCPTCGQVRPDAPAHLTDRELDVLTGWWITDSVQEAARFAGVAEQRAKNLLANARMRNRAVSNYALFVMHATEVHSRARATMQHKTRSEEAA